MDKIYIPTWDDFTKYFEIGKHKPRFNFESYKRESDIIERTGPKASGGPKGLGDPYDRTLHKCEEDPLIPQRMSDISKTVVCRKEGKEFDECAWREGVMMFFNCMGESKVNYACLIKNFRDPEFHAAVTEEYLNERSHYRTTGIRQKRYMGGTFMIRDTETDPHLDKEGKYRSNMNNL
jgi:hypothetical protein